MYLLVRDVVVSVVSVVSLYLSSTSHDDLVVKLAVRDLVAKAELDAALEYDTLSAIMHAVLVSSVLTRLGSVWSEVHAVAQQASPPDLEGLSLDDLHSRFKACA